MIRRIRATPELVWKAVVSFGFRFGGLAAQFVGSIIIARQLGAESFGAYAYAFTWATLFGMVLSLGMADLSVREIPAFLANRETGALRQYLTVMLGTVLVLGGAAAAVLFWFEQGDVLSLAPGWQLVAAVALLHGLALAASKSLSGFQRIVLSQFLDTVLRPGLYLLAIAAAILLGVTLDPASLFRISILVTLPALLFMGYVLIRSYRAATTDDFAPRARGVYWFGAALPLLMTSFTGLLQTDLDVLMVGAILGDFEVGVYRAAARAAVLATIANVIAIQVLGPMLSRAMARKDMAEAQRLLTQAALVSAGLGLTICAVFGIGASFYLGIYGPEFVVARPALQLLLVGQVLSILCGGVGMLLIMLKRERLVLMINLLALALNLGLNLLLIGPFGIIGAAIATVVSLVTLKIIMLVVIARSTDFDPTIWRPLRLAAGRLLNRS